jgi:hypothetical protein
VFWKSKEKSLLIFFYWKSTFPFFPFPFSFSFGYKNGMAYFSFFFWILTSIVVIFWFFRFAITFSFAGVPEFFCVFCMFYYRYFYALHFI